MAIIRLPQDATAWELIAETLRVLHYAGDACRCDDFHQQALGLEEDFTSAKALGERFGVRYLPSAPRTTEGR